MAQGFGGRFHAASRAALAISLLLSIILVAFSMHTIIGSEMLAFIGKGMQSLGV